MGKTFTPSEKQAIKAGFRRYGKKWTTIKNEYPDALKNRTGGQIKDAHRTMVKRGEIDPDIGPPSTSKPRVSFTDEEKASLLDGLRKYKHDYFKWSKIQESSPVLSHRTNVNLKDLYNTLKKQGKIPEDLLIKHDKGGNTATSDTNVATGSPVSRHCDSPTRRLNYS